MGAGSGLLGLAIGLATGGIGYWIGQTATWFSVGFTGGISLFNFGQAATAKRPTTPYSRTGPSINDVKVSTTGSGVPIPVVYGNSRVSCHFLYVGSFGERETTLHKRDGYRPVLSQPFIDVIALGICEGPIKNIRRIWADGKVIYDADQGVVSYDNGGYRELPFFSKVTLYNGYKTNIYKGQEGDDVLPDGYKEQLQDPDLFEILGVDTPYYSGLAYLVITDFQLYEFGNQIPTFEVELFTSSENIQEKNLPCINVGKSRPDLLPSYIYSNKLDVTGPEVSAMEKLTPLFDTGPSVTAGVTENPRTWIKFGNIYYQFPDPTNPGRVEIATFVPNNVRTKDDMYIDT